MSGPVTSARIDINEFRQWLEELVAQMQFARLIAAVIALVTKLRDMNTELTKQLAQLRRARPRSERMRALEAQLLLPFAMAASKPQSKQERSTTAGDKDKEEQKGKTTKNRRSKHPGRKPLPADLERVAQYNSVPADQRLCPVCGVAMKSMGVTHCEHLDVIPAKVVVVQRTDEALKCPLDGTIVSAPPPPRIVEKGVLGNRLIVEATADKFLERQPVERQCLRFARSGADIAPQTWAEPCALTWICSLPSLAPFTTEPAARDCSARTQRGSPCWIETAPKGSARARCGPGPTPCGSASSTHVRATRTA